ncbi:MAG: MltA domain-containing protein, partial [Pseudomonadota bacterium]
SFENEEEAASYARQPERIANRVFADNRFGLGNGNEASGDGWSYRGRGLIQLTGRNNYRDIGNRIGIDLESTPDRVLEPDIALAVTLAYWNSRNISAYADEDDLQQVTRLIHGGLNGLDTRRLYLIRAKAALGLESGTVATPFGTPESSVLPEGETQGAATPDISAPPLDLRPGDEADLCDNLIPQIRTTVNDVEPRGILVIEVYSDDAENFLSKEARLRRARVAAGTSPQRVCLNINGAGTYAVAVYHDQNGDRALDKRWNQLPAEPFALSKNPQLRLRKPRFYEASFEAGPLGANISVDLRDSTVDTQGSSPFTAPSPLPGLEVCDEFSIYFKYDDIELTSAVTSLIDDTLLGGGDSGQCDISYVSLYGHTDTAHESQYAFELSRRMASTVGQAFIKRGISPDVIETAAFGKTIPAKSTADGVREPLNRRVEVKIYASASEPEAAIAVQQSDTLPLNEGLKSSEHKLDNAPEIQIANFSSLPGWQNANLTQGVSAFARSCEKLSQKNRSSNLSDQAKWAGTLDDWLPVCSAFRGDDDEAQLRRKFESLFTPLEIQSGNTQPRFTGYFEPEFAARRSPEFPYTQPIPGLPNDLVSVDGSALGGQPGRNVPAQRLPDGTLQPYPPRSEIVGQTNEALGYAHPADVFFLQIQGSGLLRFKDGTSVRAEYAGHNGHPFASVVNYLIQTEQISREQATMEGIREWMDAVPREVAQAAMNENPRFIFFQPVFVVTSTLGPRGAQGVPLTPLGSVAVDTNIHPLGIPFFIQTIGPGLGGDWSGLLVSQDTGGAIRGSTRGDIFFGIGNEAGANAGGQNAPGRMWVLLPNAVARKLLASSGK